MATRATRQVPASIVRLSLSVETPSFSPWGVRHLACHVAGRCPRRACHRESAADSPLDTEDSVSVDVSAMNPFFSPDGAWVGFFTPSGAGAGLKVVTSTGGVPVTLVATTERPAGASWGTDGTIAFATAGGLYLVLSGDGGDARLLTKPDAARRERGYAWPEWLPDGRSLLLTIVPPDSIDGAQIAMLDVQATPANLRSCSRRALGPRYLPTGHLAYASAGALKVVTFDAATRRAGSEPLRIADVPVAITADNGAGISVWANRHAGRHPSGVVAQPTTADALAGLDRRGAESPVPLPPRHYW